MRNLVVLIVLLLLCVTVSFADALAVSSLYGIAAGGHDIFLPEAPTLYRGGVMRMPGVVTIDDISYVRFGFLSGDPVFGASIGAGIGRTAVLHDFAEVGLRGGMDFDTWFGGLIVAAPHVKFQIKSLLSNPTSLYVTVAGGFPWNAPVNYVQPSRLYAFVGVKQGVGPLELDVAVGNRNTVRLGVAVKGDTLPLGFGYQLLRSPDQDSIAAFLVFYHQ